MVNTFRILFGSIWCPKRGKLVNLMAGVSHEILKFPLFGNKINQRDNIIM
jgi:hypothetical protein